VRHENADEARRRVAADCASSVPAGTIESSSGSASVSSRRRAEGAAGDVLCP
jgi:hypothetical protein